MQCSLENGKIYVTCIAICMKAAMTNEHAASSIPAHIRCKGLLRKEFQAHEEQTLSSLMLSQTNR